MFLPAYWSTLRPLAESFTGYDWKCLCIMYTIESFLWLHSYMFKGLLLTVICCAECWKYFVRSLDCPHLCFYKFRLACTKIIVEFFCRSARPIMIVSGYMNFFTVAYVFRFSILDSLTHKSKLILCAVDVVIIFLNGLFASHLRKDPWRTVRWQSRSVSNLCFIYH